MRFRAFIWPGVGMVGVSYCWLFLISLVGVVVWVHNLTTALALYRMVNVPKGTTTQQWKEARCTPSGATSSPSYHWPSP
nr:MAG TPA: hypothetical protein [Caudoviricetes sp.]